MFVGVGKVKGEKEVVRFVATVRLQRGLLETGRVASKALLPLVGRKLEFSAKEINEMKDEE